MPTIHQNKMTGGTHDLTAVQQAKVADVLRQNDCPYFIFCERDTDDAAPVTIVVLQVWAQLVGQALSKVLDPDKPVPPASAVALSPVSADNGEVVPFVMPEPVGSVARAA